MLALGGRSYRTKVNDSALRLRVSLRLLCAHAPPRALRSRPRARAGGGINPTWNEHFAFAAGGDTQLAVSLYDAARVGTDECIGKCTYAPAPPRPHCPRPRMRLTRHVTTSAFRWGSRSVTAATTSATH